MQKGTSSKDSKRKGKAAKVALLQLSLTEAFLGQMQAQHKALSSYSLLPTPKSTVEQMRRIFSAEFEGHTLDEYIRGCLREGGSAQSVL